MTEEEAKTKTCHKTLGPVASADGSAPWHSPAACIGSVCMAWRLDGPAVERAEIRKMGRLPEGEGWRCTLPETGREGFAIKSIWERDVPQHGFCGLAGKP